MLTWYGCLAHGATQSSYGDTLQESVLPPIKCMCLLCDKLSGSFRGNASTRYGQRHEGQALEEYLQHQQLQAPSFCLSPSALVVKEDTLWLAVTLNAMATDPSAGVGVVEVKCPHLCREKQLKSAALNSSFCLCSRGGALSLRRSRPYFYQVQHQMYVCDVEYADFVVWTPHELFVQRVARDRAFFDDVFLRLKDFYFGHLLPALYSEIL